jgi:N-acetylneuraminic acid mutarotase
MSMRKTVALLLALFFLTAPCVMVAKPGFSSAEVVEDSWVSKASMHESRVGLGVAVVNGKIYALGGRDKAIVGTNEEYDPATDMWLLKAPMPTPRSNFGVAVYQNKIYCIGGRNGGVTGVNEVYDPETDTWESKTSLPTPRDGVEASEVGGRIYVMGGGSNVNEVYDPATDSWTTKASMPATPGLFSSWSCASVVFDGKIHVIGATPRSNSHQIYDPTTDSWSFGEPLIAGYYFAVAGATTGVNAPKRIYVFGAASSLWTINVPTLTSQSYDPKTNSWTMCASIPAGHLNAGVAVVDDKLYVIGGGGAGYANAVYANALNRLYTPIGYGTPDLSYMPSTDSTAPKVAVLSPENKTYNATNVPLIFTVDELGSWTRYRLDAQVVEVAGNATLTGLSYGAHKVTVYATDVAGNTSASETIIFTIAKEPEPFPTILVAAALVLVAVVGVGLFVYFKKKERVE